MVTLSGAAGPSFFAMWAGVKGLRALSSTSSIAILGPVRRRPAAFSIRLILFLVVAFTCALHFFVYVRVAMQAVDGAGGGQFEVRFDK